MKFLVRASALALVLTFSSGAHVSGTTLVGSEQVRLAAAWGLLTPEQQQVIDLVAKDIWDTERSDRPVTYHQLSSEEKTKLRAEAMDRLGFKPPRIAGYEV